MMTVCCVWQPSKIYNDRYPVILRNMVARHLSVPHRFVCVMTEDIPLPVERIVLESNLGGWWSKLQLFSPPVAEALGNDCLYFDLDTVIIRSIDMLAAIKSPMAFLRNWNTFLDGRPRLSSAVMRWKIDPTFIWSHFERNAASYDLSKDEQSVIIDALEGNCSFLDDELPPYYFLDWPRNFLGVFVDGEDFFRTYRTTSVLVFAGHSKPSDLVVRYKWIKENWQ